MIMTISANATDASCDCQEVTTHLCDNERLDYKFNKDYPIMHVFNGKGGSP